uniref:Putative membrane protein insertion efficiency factor n=1 Tax=Candidatus Kentrum sp. TC TaxID=2126339 RepID=A0A450YMF2_9GAMM|nr:MAG: putative membrane protein insertion efficiency factor [Candidatus Kentron sp. TC]
MGFGCGHNRSIRDGKYRKRRFLPLLGASLEEDTQPMRRVVKFFIRLYQYAVSPFLPPSCRFYPSCSAYALEAVERYGCVRGLWLGARRILRCHPWHPGGFDPVPPLEEKTPSSCGSDVGENSAAQRHAQGEKTSHAPHYLSDVPPRTKKA